jgi:hypothetical protein
MPPRRQARVIAILAAISLLVAAPAASAQGTTLTKEEQEARIRAILNLPSRADEVRKAGVPDSTVQRVIEIFGQKRVPPEEAEQILITERDAAREHGPTDNFGAFVQARLDEGLRGRELAAAIRAEHAARGKGRGNAGNAGRGNRPPEAGRGKAPDAVQDGAARGKRPDDAATRGKRPDSTGAARGKRPN